MAQSFDDELMQDAVDDTQCVEFIRAYLPQELKEKFSDDELFYFLDVIVDYYANSGILDQEADADGCIDIDMEELSRHMAKTALKDKMGEYVPEELLWIANGEAEYSEQFADEE